VYSRTLYDDADRELGSRRPNEGVMRVGRDLAADWVIDDPQLLISRVHLELRLEGSRLSMSVLGANGVALGEPPQKLPQDAQVELSAGDCIRLGTYRIVVAETEDQATSTPRSGKTGDAASAPTQPLLDAFCEGAGLDPSHFIAEDPVVIMTEAGAVYREMINGLDALLRERAAVRSRMEMDRTTIRVNDNNLLKWAPSQRLAIDLLTKKDSSFLTGADAVRASFADVRKHLTSVMGGYRSAVRALIDCLRPETLAAGAKRRLLRDSTTDSWERFVALHAELDRQAADDCDGVIRRGFSEGYDRSMLNCADGTVK
jgi:predicted component of type VI protein secretion system